MKENTFYILGCLYFSLIIGLINTNSFNLTFACLVYIFTFIILFTARINIFTFILSCIILASISLYYPFSIYFKITQPGVFQSILQTNHQEAKEFLYLINYKFIFFYILSSFMFFCYIRKKPKFKNKIQLKVLLCLSIYFYVLLDGSIDRIIEIKKSYTSYQNELIKIKISKYKTDDWQITKSQIKKDTIVVIIGESVSKKYLSAYGYSKPTTPFLDNVNGTFYQNFISPAGYTPLSIPRIIAITDSNHNINYQTNAVSLANKAGFNTYWLSNQGFIGEHDSAVSNLSIKSKNLILKNKSDFLNSYQSDLVLLSDIKKIIETSNDEKNVIFVHMLGSHMEFCERLRGYEIKFKSELSQNYNCYISSIHLLDHFIRNIQNFLNTNSKKFSIIYFSDHGLSPIGKNHDFNLIHGDKHRENFDVPLIILRDEDKEKKIIHEPTSGLNFLYIFSKELGVETTNLKIQHPIKVLSQNQWIDYNQLAK